MSWLERVVDNLPIIGDFLDTGQKAVNLYTSVAGATGSDNVRGGGGHTPAPYPTALQQAASGIREAQGVAQLPGGSASQGPIAQIRERGRQDRLSMAEEARLRVQAERELWRIRSEGAAGFSPPEAAPRDPAPIDTDQLVQEFRRVMEGTGRKVPPRPGPRRYGRRYWRGVSRRFSPRRR